MVYMDDTALKLGKMELEAGEFPKRGNEIAVSQGLLEALGITAGIGDTIHCPISLSSRADLAMRKRGNSSDYRTASHLRGTKRGKDVFHSGFQRVYGTGAARGLQEIQSNVPNARRTDSMTRNQIENAYGKVAAELGIPEGDIADNSSYLMANYVDPAFYSGIVGILL